MAVELKTQIRNGKMYYIIGSSELNSAPAIIVQTIAERNALGEVNGFVIVRNPQAGSPKDTTVHRGWAMYVRYTDGSKGVGWLKVAEEESVNGVWGVEEELLKQFATKSMLEAFILQQRDKNRLYDTFGARINELVLAINQILAKPILNLLTVKNNYPAWKLAIAEGVYKEIYLKDIFIYDNRGTSSLFWKNPGNLSATAVAVSSSFDIAERFLISGFAYEGETLRVVELDRSISEFLIYSDGTNLKYKFRGNSREDNVCYVQELPEASEKYVGAGLFYLLPTSEETQKEINRFYKCVNIGSRFEWVSAESSLGTDLRPSVTVCYRESFDRVRLLYQDPPEVDTAENMYWLKTTVVRKIGEPPKSVSDGIVINASTTHNEFSTGVGLIDYVPYADGPIYYGIFSESTNHRNYSAAFITADFICFENQINDLIQSNKFKDVFNVGDAFITGRVNPIGKSLKIVVSKIEDDGTVYMTSVNSIGRLPLDGKELGMKPSARTSWTPGIDFYQAVTTGSQTIYNKVTSSSFTGSPKDNNLFERYSSSYLYNPSYDASGKLLHGNSHFSNSNLVRWLNGEAYDPAFVPATECDTDGLNLPDGFPDDASATDLINIADEITLPSEDNGGIDVIVEEALEGDGWAEGTDEEGMTSPTFLFTAGSVSASQDLPENAHEVYPVFVFRRYS